MSFTFIFFAGVGFLFFYLGGFFPVLGVFFFLFALAFFVRFLKPIMPKNTYKVLNWIHALCLEPLSFLAVILVFPFTFFKDRFFPKDKKAILFIHGYLHFSSVWFFQKFLLKRKGFFSIYTINLGYPFDSIENYAYKLKRKIDLIKKNTDLEKLILVGHSMGGVVASYYALFLDEQNFVNKVITIGSPIQGTKMALFGVGRCTKQMKRESVFLKKIFEKMKSQKDGPDFFHLVTRTDQLVVPYSSAYLQENPHVILDDIGHNSLLFSLAVNKVLFHWLKTIEKQPSYDG